MASKRLLYARLAVSHAALKELAAGDKTLLAVLQMWGRTDGVWGDKEDDDATKQRLAYECGVSVDTITERLGHLKKIEFARWEKKKQNREGFQQYIFYVQPFPKGEEFLPLDMELLKFHPSQVSDGAKLFRAFLEYRSRYRSKYQPAFPGYENIAQGLGYERRNVIRLAKEYEAKLGISHARQRRRSNLWKVDRLLICDSVRRPPFRYPNKQAEPRTTGNRALQEMGIVHFKNRRIVHTEESTLKENTFKRAQDTDLDYLATNRKNRGLQPEGVVITQKGPAGHEILRETSRLIMEYVGRYPKEGEMLDIRAEALGWDDSRIAERLGACVRSSPEPPRTVKWFRTALRDVIRQGQSIETPSYAPTHRMPAAEVDQLTDAFDSLSRQEAA